MTDTDSDGQHSRRRVLAGGAGVSLGLTSLVLPTAAQAASPGSQSSPPAQPSISASYSTSTDLVTLSFNRTGLDAGAISTTAFIYTRGGTAKYDAGDPTVAWAADAYAAPLTLGRQLIVRVTTVPGADDDFYAYASFPAPDNVALYSTGDGTTTSSSGTRLEFTGAPTVYFTSLQETKATDFAKSVSSSSSIDVTITKPASALDIDLIMLAGVAGEAWVPGDLSVDVLEDPMVGPNLGTLSYLADDGQRLAVLASDTPISLGADLTSFTLRVKSSSATSRLSYTDSSSVDGATGWSHGSLDNQDSGYARWSLGLRS